MNAVAEKQEKSELKPPVKRSRKIFWLLLLVSGLPYLVSWIWFANMDNMPELAPSNRGELITPVRSIAGLTLQNLNAEQLQTDSLKGNWLLIMAGNSSCDEACLKNVFYMRQVRRLMGEDRQKIQRIFLLTDQEKTSEFAEKIKPFEGMSVVTTDSADGEQLLKSMSINGAQPHNRIFIADPAANLMMAYQSDVDPEDIAKDFRRLIKLVRIGKPKQAG
jgi:cytochrome oxidase Cu insertion factor (SCO1/SenC/PrrC family)